MIRPITCLCFLLACGSGLYLYQSKHRVQLLDRQIEDTVHATEKLREQTRVLHAEWTLLNDPQRLQTLADQFLTLKTVQPPQFTSMADLDNRLPAVPPPAPVPPPEPQSVPVAQAAEPAQPDKPTQPLVADAAAAKPAEPTIAASPPRPRPAEVAAVTSPPSPRPVDVAAVAVPHAPERKPVRPPAVVADVVRPQPAPYVPPRPIMAADLTRPVVAVRPPSAPFTGSALGMARSSVALPQPMPVSSPWANSQGGGG
jgi:hypothetical protein